jgi:dihydroflavonol-4-reductase
MNTFVTGGTGFIGSHLIDALSSLSDMEIYALVRDLHKKKWLEGRDIHCLEGNLHRLPSLPDGIDYVFHLAGTTKAHKSADYYTVNQEGSASLFKTLASLPRPPRKVVVLSSLAAAGPSESGQAVKETDPARPLTPYGRSKLAGEAEALKYKDSLPLVIVRVGAVFGPRDRDFVTYFRFIRRGIMPSFGSPRHLMSLCYVKDLAAGLIKCLEATTPSGTIFNLGDPQPYSWDDFGRASGRILGKSPRTVHFPLPVVYLIAYLTEIWSKISRRPNILDRHKIQEIRQDAWVADIGRAREVLGFRAEFSLESALEETITWYKEQGWL